MVLYIYSKFTKQYTFLAFVKRNHIRGAPSGSKKATHGKAMQPPSTEDKGRRTWRPCLDGAAWGQIIRLRCTWLPAVFGWSPMPNYRCWLEYDEDTILAWYCQCKAELSDTNCNVALYMKLLLLHIFQLVTAVHVLYSWPFFLKFG